MDPTGRNDSDAWPARRGALTALAAALLFGLSTPLVRIFGAGVGSFTTAGILYAGAAMTGAALQRRVDREAALGRADAARLAWIAGFGALLGPVALAWGLQHTSAASASLMLTLEAVFTALLARLWYAESMDRRVVLALSLLTLGAMVIAIDRAGAGRRELAGIAAVVIATVAWAMDNTLSRSLSTRDPGQVVLAKSALGAAAAAVLAGASGEALPGVAAVVGLLCVGAAGYGLSLRLYLFAQRSFGAARTASVFAFAPFAGALAALALGERTGGAWLPLGAALMVAGVVLHLAEEHRHEHLHGALEHEHAHTHDDGHHTHVHDPMPAGPHNHLHRHEPLRHAHAHVPDAHHTHRH